MKLRRGDIVRNNWAGHPCVRYFVYTHSSKNNIFGIEIFNGKPTKAEYSKSVVNKPFADGKPGFEVVGRSKMFDVMRDDLNQFIEPEMRFYEKGEKPWRKQELEEAE
ncbi:hypothetical protein [Enterococcus diestrammenae]|uniref:Uncharacterized protein n=1 Tax=Enterococcus diestrammenae TaxID=1155073 RepID=A0ABV0F5D7_9ENTE|nr:hypothetical protein [Enterococcus diestrammenae]KAF1300036.1 hypothetical protein BAU18_13035 [Enterococcus diestrammenae]